MKYYLIAGEASGDKHGARLIQSLKKYDEKAEFRFWGGENMADASGKRPVVGLEKLNYMGFGEVIRHLPTILSNIKRCKKDIAEWKPDILIPIDFPGFNMRIAKWNQKNPWPTAYYIAPQVWAWKESRVEKIKKYVNVLYVILPFEKAYFEEKGMEAVEYYGHPLLDAYTGIQQWQEDRGDKREIALLAGSRDQEVKQLLPLMLKATSGLKDYEVLISKAPSVQRKVYEDILKAHQASHRARIFEGPFDQLFQNVAAAIVTSGTATLETSLFGIPQIVVYKGSSINYWVARRLVQVDYISLVNLISGEEIVPELIQSDCTPSNIRNHLSEILGESDRTKKIRQGYRNLHSQLGNPGVSDRIAKSIISHLK